MPPQAYVAVVAETEPWSEPAREAIVQDGDGVEWGLPPGRYRVVAGAPGYTLEYRPVVEIAPGAAATQRVVLAPLVPVEGRVTDREGAPVAGAVVSDLRQLVYGFSGRLSPLGESHLRPAFEAVSDEEGRFRKLFHPQGGAYVAVIADGRTPRFFPNLRVGAAAVTLRAVVLTPGASLAVSWPTTGPDPAPYDRVELLPSDRRFPPGLELTSALAVWARSVEAGPERPAAVWTSLPPGGYEVWLKAPPRGAHDLVPVRLAAVTLAPGQHVEQEVELARSAKVPAKAEGAKASRPGLEILTPRLPAPEAASLRVRGWWGQAPEDLTLEPTSVSGGTLLTIGGACRSGVLVTVESDAQVGGVSLPATPDCAEARRIDLAPRADVSARLAPPPGVDLPAMAFLDVAPCVSAPGPAGEAVTALAGQIDPTGRLTAAVPAGCVDLTARIGDFAPVVWQDLDLTPGSDRDLGAQQLRYGAALLARVLSSLDGRPVEGVTVSVVAPHQATEMLQGGAKPSGGRLSGAETSEDGWARLYGLPPGRELAVLLQDAGRPVPHPAAVVELASGEERVLDALELPPPTELAIQVELSAALEEIDATPYKVFARQIGSDTLGIGLSQEVDPDGSVRFLGLPPGRYRLEGIVRAGGGRPFPAGTAEVELHAGEQKAFHFALEDSLFRGRVTYEGIPVEGALAIQPVSPEDRRGMNVLLSPEGEFRLPLEGPGTYTVRITDMRDERFADAVIPAVVFEEPEEEVHLRMPEARIAGRVIDADGEPVPDVRLELFSRQTLDDDRFLTARRIAHADRAGRFKVEALTAGAWTLTAKAPDLASEPRVVHVAPNERVEDLELVLREARAISGTVSDAWGQPVAGADLWVTPQTSTASEFPSLLHATTDARGAFALSTVVGPRPANVEVVTADGKGAALRIELGREIGIELPAIGGAVEVDLPCSRKGAWLSGTYYLVGPAGGYLPVPRLGRIGASTKEPCRVHREIPGLASGLWKVVLIRTAAEDSLLLAGQAAALSIHGEVLSQVGAPSHAVVDPEKPRGSETEREKSGSE